MAVKTLSVFLLFVAVCFAATPTTQLLNYLIANSGNVVSNYNSLGLQAGTACSATAPAANTIPASIRLCRASSNVFPYNNGTSGLEVDLVNTFNTTFRTQYPTTAYPFSWVVVNTATGYYDSLRAAVRTGTCDVILADIFKTDARDLDFESSCSYGQTRTAFGRSFRNSNTTVTTFADFVAAANSGLAIKVGFVAGSVYQAAANQLPANVEKISFSGTAAGFVFLANNTIDAFFSDESTLISNRNSVVCDNNGVAAQCTVTAFTAPNSVSAFQLVAYSAANTTTTTTTTGGRTTLSVTTSTSAASSFSMVAAAVAALFAALMIIA